MQAFTMTATLTPPNTDSIQLSGISWQTYERLLTELSDRRLRLTYNRGSLEIMSPSPEHEFGKEMLGRFVETLAEEFEIEIYPLGSTTFKHPELSGAEPDKCFYIRNISAIQGKARLDPFEDPAPDLVIEIDITNRSQNRLQIYADLGVAEVWIYNGTALSIKQLENGQYNSVSTSQFFPDLPLLEITKFLQRSKTRGYLEIVRSFRTWIREQLDG
jgi:Uma2 family endonuclease